MTLLTSLICATLGAMIVLFRDSTASGFFVPLFIMVWSFLDSKTAASLRSRQSSLDAWMKWMKVEGPRLGVPPLIEDISVKHRAEVFSVVSKMFLLALGIGFFLLSLFNLP